MSQDQEIKDKSWICPDCAYRKKTARNIIFVFCPICLKEMIEDKWGGNCG